MDEVRSEGLRRAGKRAGQNRPKRWRRAAIALTGLMLAGVVAIEAVHDTLSDPVVHRQTLPLPGLPPAAAPLRLLLMSDIHVAGPDMPPERVARIVAQVNALHPDMVLIAGDFTSDKLLATRHYPLDQALAPLAGLRSRWGTVAVLGNHDYDPSAVAMRAGLEKLGIRVLQNDAIRLGPITLGGLGDSSYRDARWADTFTAMHKLGPPYILLAHEPDAFIHQPRDIPLVLAGHTHCGQIALPLIGPIATHTNLGRRYACGLVREHGKTLVVTGGLGTSDLPFRFGVQPDVWLLQLTPAPIAP